MHVRRGRDSIFCVAFSMAAGFFRVSRNAAPKLEIRATPRLRRKTQPIIIPRDVGPIQNKPAGFEKAASVKRLCFVFCAAFLLILELTQ